MRVVARQHVNEVASDALLLLRARRQIIVLRRRLREAETVALPLTNLPKVGVFRGVSCTSGYPGNLPGYTLLTGVYFEVPG